MRLHYYVGKTPVLSVVGRTPGYVGLMGCMIFHHITVGMLKRIVEFLEEDALWLPRVLVFHKDAHTLDPLCFLCRVFCKANETFEVVQMD